jgi:hypothetical protein
MSLEHELGSLLIKRPAWKKKPFNVTNFFFRSETPREASRWGILENLAESIRRNAIEMGGLLCREM